MLDKEENDTVDNYDCIENTDMRMKMVDLCEEVMSKGYPNAWGAQIPIYSPWNLEVFEQLLEGYEDTELIMWLKFGWPISRPPNINDPTPTFRNHGTAEKYPEFIEKYIDKELKRGGICGPFDQVPFSRRVGVSPLSTRPKRDTEDRRVLMDLSWPEKSSVNFGIAKDQFMGFATKLTFPTIDIIARRIAESPEDMWLFKVDLSAYFRQLILDPGDYSLMCFCWNDQIYFDLVSPQGLRSAPYFAQRTSNGIRYIHNKKGYFLFNYIDDFIGAEVKQKIESSYEVMIDTLNKIGIRESKEKRIPPTQVLNCVGTLVDAESRVLKVIPERQLELLRELHEWNEREYCNLKQLQSLIGKLNFICAVIRPGRLFLARMLEKLRSQGNNANIVLDDEFKKDIQWWQKYLPTFNGSCIMWMHQVLEPDAIAASDACLIAMGAVSEQEYITVEFPEHLKGDNIAVLELWAIIVMVKTWIHKFANKRCIFRCDNLAVCDVLNSGRAWNKMLLILLRELIFLASGVFEFRAIHILDRNNTLPDLLSRWHEGRSIHTRFYELTKDLKYKQIQVAPDVFELLHTW